MLFPCITISVDCVNIQAHSPNSGATSWDNGAYFVTCYVDTGPYFVDNEVNTVDYIQFDESQTCSFQEYWYVCGSIGMWDANLQRWYDGGAGVLGVATTRVISKRSGPHHSLG